MFGKLLRVIYAIPNASVILARNETRLARNETRLARNETRGGNLLLSGTVGALLLDRRYVQAKSKTPSVQQILRSIKPLFLYKLTWSTSEIYLDTSLKQKLEIKKDTMRDSESVKRPVEIFKQGV